MCELKPHIDALDIGMPNLNGLDAARQILRRAPHQKILFMTIYESEQVIRAVRETGAKGLILKSDAARELISAVEALQHNSTFFSTRVAQTCLGNTKKDQHRGRGKDEQTRRQHQVIILMVKIKIIKEI